MRVESWINICNIIVDRHSISQQTFDLALKIKLGEIKIEELPAIKLDMNSNGTYILKDGRHRITALKLLGEKRIKSKYFKWSHSSAG